MRALFQSKSATLFFLHCVFASYFYNIGFVCGDGEVGCSCFSFSNTIAKAMPVIEASEQVMAEPRCPRNALLKSSSTRTLNEHKLTEREHYQW